MENKSNILATVKISSEKKSISSQSFRKGCIMALLLNTTTL
jgi:hypothetical protein